MPTTFVPSSATTRAARMPRSLRGKRSACFSNTFSNTPQLGTTAPDNTQHRTFRVPIRQSSFAHTPPCMHPNSVKSNVSVQSDRKRVKASSLSAAFIASFPSSFPSASSSSKKAPFNSTLTYFASRSSSSISKSEAPVFGRVTAKVFLVPGLVSAKITCARPYISRRMR